MYVYSKLLQASDLKEKGREKKKKNSSAKPENTKKKWAPEGNMELSRCFHEREKAGKKNMRKRKGNVEMGRGRGMKKGK